MRSDLAAAAPGTFTPKTTLNAPRSDAAALLSGALLSLAWPEFDIAPLAWVALIPLLHVARSQRPTRGFALGALFGLGFFGSLLIWISSVGWIAWALLVVLQSLFTGLFGSLWAFTSRTESRWWRVLLAPVLWVAIEWLRATVPLGGFTWGELAQSQHNAAWMLRPAAWGGGWAVGFIVVLVNVLLAEAALSIARKSRGAAVGLGVAAVLVLGAPLLLGANNAGGERITLSIVQGNVPRDFSGDAYDKELAIIRSHEHLTSEVGIVEPDLVVWPESAVGLDVLDNPDAQRAIRDAALSVDTPLLIGGNLDVGSDRYKVMTFQISPEGEVLDSYQKRHLVPFGEFVPGRDWLGWVPMLDQVPRDAMSGDEPGVFDVAGGKVATVISFEGDFGSLVRTGIDAGGRLLVVATNTSTWGESAASAQHVAFSQVRAAENSVWVAHAALSGISAFISPDGTVVDRTPLWTAAAMTREVSFAEDVTFYARVGDWLPYACVVLSLVALVVAVRSMRRNRRAFGLRG